MRPLIQRALDEGWIDLTFMAGRLGRPLALADVAGLLADAGQRDLALSARFDGGAYLERYPDVAASGMPPLVHFLRFGQVEGRMAFADHGSVVQNLPLCPGGWWVESHDLGLTGAPIALSHVLAGLGCDRLGPLLLAAPCAGPMGDVLAQAAGTRAAGAHGGVVLHGQAAARLHSPAQADAMVARCAALLARSQVGRVLANSALSWPMVLAAQSLGLPVVWIIHEPDDRELRESLPAPLAAHLDRAMQPGRATRLVFVAQASQAAWGAAQAPHAHLIPKALPPAPPPTPAQRAAGRALAQCQAGDVLVLSVGTFSPRKGQIDLIAALEALAPQPLAAQLVAVLVGDQPSPTAQTLRSRAKALRARGLRVQLWPQSQSLAQRAEVEQLFAAADLFVMSSRAESLPLALAEAFAAHCPVIATEAPGIAEMVAVPQMGRLYPAGQGAELAAHLAELASQPDLRAQMRADIAAAADPQAYARMIAAYAQLLAMPKLSGPSASP